MLWFLHWSSVIHSVAHKYTYLLGCLNIDISMNWGVSDLTDKHKITSIMSMEVANQYTDPDTGFKVCVRQFFCHFDIFPSKVLQAIIIFMLSCHSDDPWHTKTWRDLEETHPCEGGICTSGKFQFETFLFQWEICARMKLPRTNQKEVQ